jgi:hypothetical protein
MAPHTSTLCMLGTKDKHSFVLHAGTAAHRLQLTGL